MSGTAEATATHTFQIDVPDEQLAALRRRIVATRWPSAELVADRSQGVQLATLQALTRHWTTDYDWRKVEARLNALPQFMTEIDGVEIYFIHVRSRHENGAVLPMPPGEDASCDCDQQRHDRTCGECVATGRRRLLLRPAEPGRREETKHRGGRGVVTDEL
jgi:Epoxide hydrolase N terminus